MLILNDSRIAELKRKTIGNRPYLETDRMKIAVESYEKYDTMPALLKRARVFKDILEQIPVAVFDDEIIVGTMGKHANCAQLYAPESSISWLTDEIEGISQRKQDPFLVSDEDRKYIAEMAVSLKGKTLADEIGSKIPAEGKTYINSNVFFVQKDVGYGHSLADYEYVLKYGLKGIIEQCERKDDSFYEAVIICCRALKTFAERYAEEAEKQLKTCKDEQRCKELEEIARVCRKVPYQPADSFHEALQAIWFIQLAIHLESDGTGVSFGRFDQYVYPYYLNSLNRGEDRETLKTMLECFWIKTNHIYKCRNSGSAALWSGYIVNQNITVGGYDISGKDLSNELTLMCLHCQEVINMKEPQLSLLVGEDTPEEVMEAAMRSIARGGGKPQFVSQKAVMKAMTIAGISEEEAYKCAIIGCVEPSVPGAWNRCKSGHINFPKILEITLNNGFDPVLQKQVGPQTGSLDSFNSFEQFFEAFKVQLRHTIEVVSEIHRNVTHRLLQEKLPHPFLSSLVPGCLEKGMDFTAGGSNHNWTCFTITGLANVVDSMYALKELLFEGKVFSAEELLTALHHDFKDAQKIREEMIRLPKYGNNDSSVNAMTQKVTDALYTSTEGLKGHLNSDIYFGYVTVTKSVSMGSHTGALPDGRKAFTPFADGISPSHGSDNSGPLAILESSEHINLERAVEGCILNQKYLPSFVNDPFGRQALKVMIKTYLSRMKGMHIQFNVVSGETLRDAQKHPENYRELLVRVSGYSAYFVELSREVQQDIITRTELSI